MNPLRVSAEGARTESRSCLGNRCRTFEWIRRLSSATDSRVVPVRCRAQCPLRDPRLGRFRRGFSASTAVRPIAFCRHARSSTLVDSRCAQTDRSCCDHVPNELERRFHAALRIRDFRPSRTELRSLPSIDQVPSKPGVGHPSEDAAWTASATHLVTAAYPLDSLIPGLDDVRVAGAPPWGSSTLCVARASTLAETDPSRPCGPMHPRSDRV